MLQELYPYYVKWAKKQASKFDLSKYQLVHLSRKKKKDINQKFVLDNNHIIKSQKSGILLRLEIDKQIQKASLLFLVLLDWSKVEDLRLYGFLISLLLYHS